MRVSPDDLRAQRETLGLSQTAIAERLGIPRNTWWRWEAGEAVPGHGVILTLALERLAQLNPPPGPRRGRPPKHAAPAHRTPPRAPVRATGAPPG